jgi:hypothetical protein
MPTSDVALGAVTLKRLAIAPSSPLIIAETKDFVFTHWRKHYFRVYFFRENQKRSHNISFFKAIFPKSNKE